MESLHLSYFSQDKMIFNVVVLSVEDNSSKALKIETELHIVAPILSMAISFFKVYFALIMIKL